MAKATAKKVVKRRRERKNVEKGAVHIRSSFNNTIEKTTAVLGARNGMPRQRRVRSTILPGNLQVRKALTERRYIGVCGRRSARKPATAKGEALGEPSKKPDGLMARPVHKSDHSTILRGYR